MSVSKTEIDHVASESETPLPIRYIARTLRAYTPAILLTVGVVAIGYTILAILLYLLSPAVRVTSIPFRLDFRGAAEGTYPNGMKFSAAEIVSTPILLQVYRENDLARFTAFSNFARSVYVLESNPALERLTFEYQARLADTKLTPVERDRVQREFELKRSAINKNEYSINYSRSTRISGMPEDLVRKTLSDILQAWSRFAINEQRVLSYQVAVLSSNVPPPTIVEQNEPLIALHVLRGRTLRAINNVDDVAALPGSTLVKTEKDGLTLTELRFRLDDLLRDRLEPLVGFVISNGMFRNRTDAVAFLQTQLAHDERNLSAATADADTVRRSLEVYFMNQRPLSDPTTPGAKGGTQTPVTPPSEMVLTEGFLDRILNLTNSSGDSSFRQSMVQEYRSALSRTIPLQQAVDYNNRTLDALRNAPAGGQPANPGVQQQINIIRAELSDVLRQVNEIYGKTSRNLAPPTQMYTQVSAPFTRLDRSRNPGALALMGLALILAALIGASVLALLHQKIRQTDDEFDGRGRSVTVE